jgi:hypothetical protein
MATFLRYYPYLDRHIPWTGKHVLKLDSTHECKLYG